MPYPRKVYLDANFLIAYFANNHDDHDSSKILFFNLLKQDCKMHISVLGLDEAWFKVWEVLQKDISKEDRKSFREFYAEIKQILESLEGLSENIKIIQFEKSLENGVKQSVENIGRFDMRPRDAFHLAYMQDVGLKAIITKDKRNFDKVPNVSVISY